MSITRDEVAHLAGCPGWPWATKNSITSPASWIRSSRAVARVQEVAADEIPPTTHAVPVTNVFRDDVECAVPRRRGRRCPRRPRPSSGRFRVPRILAED